MCTCWSSSRFYFCLSVCVRVVICPLGSLHPILRDVPPPCSQQFFSASLVVIAPHHCSRGSRNHVGDLHAAGEHDHQQLLFQRGNLPPPADFEFLRCPRQDQVRVHHRSTERMEAQPNFIKTIPDRTNSTITIEVSDRARARERFWDHRQIRHHGVREGHECWRRHLLDWTDRRGVLSGVVGFGRGS